MGSLISWNNLADAATLTNSSDGTEQITEANVQSAPLGTVFRQTLTTASPLESVVLDFDFGSSQDISLVGILGHNVGGASYALALSNTAAGNTDVASDSGTLWTGTAHDVQNAWLQLAATYSAQYLRITITPAAGQDVDIGRIWVDDPWTPKVSIEFEHTVEDESVKQRSLGNTAYVYQRPRYRSCSMRFVDLDETDALGNESAHTMMMAVGTSGEVVVIPETFNAQVIHKLGIYGYISRSSPLVHEAHGDGTLHFTMRCTVEESR
jgi:hypothetical protein